jgi:hypothetical protein
MVLCQSLYVGIRLAYNIIRNEKSWVIITRGVKMKKIFFSLIFLLGLGFIFIGCEEKVYVVRPDHTPPSVPKGLYSITADEAVWLFWEENDEEDFAGYRIYKKKDIHSNKYYHLVTLDTAAYIDYDVKNGKTYYYGVTAFDYDGNESDLSDIGYDTPRPEGFDWRMYDHFYKPSLSGFDFSEPEVLYWRDDSTDIYLEYDVDLETFFLCVANELTDIQDFGYTEHLDDVDWSPLKGWSKVGWVEVIEGHSYIIWTANDHYAKLRVEEIVADTKIYFDWAYQIDGGNRELGPRPPHRDGYLRVAAKR